MQIVLADVVLDFPQTGEKMHTHKHMDAKTYESKAAIHICSFSRCQNRLVSPAMNGVKQRYRQMLQRFAANYFSQAFATFHTFRSFGRSPYLCICWL